MKPFVILVALLPAIAAAPAPVTPRATPLPAAVREYVIELGRMCTDVGGTTGKSPDIIKSVDLTGDGLVDYVVDAAAFNCEGAASALSNGQSGSDVSVFVAGPANSAAKAYSGSVYATRIDESGPRARLYVGVSGQLCGQRNAAGRPFAEQTFCLRPLNWLAARHAFVLAPIAEKRPFPPD